MKQHHSIFPPAASLACALILMLAACTSDALDELPPAGTDPDARPLTITVSDGGMYATGQTRAQERGYSTIFTEGDCIGLYVVKDGTLEVKNLCLTLQGGKWTLPAGASQLLYSPDKSYHAYYPYQNDSYMNGKVLLPGDEDFFKSVVETWLVNPDQSTYAQYTASDLMTARGVYNNHTLSFAMEHRMSLFILQVPATKYTYIEKIDGQEISKSYYRYTAVISENSYWQENPCTARLLLNTTDPTHLNPGPYEYYYNGNRETFNFDYSQLKLQPGKYTVHTLDDSKVTEEFRSLKAGDYYMQDGSILPGDEVSNLSRDERKSCLGVVFWVGEIEGMHWTRPMTFPPEGDRLLMRDHPECVHGMVVAMHDASQEVKWATGKGATEDIYDWADQFKYFTLGEQADWEEIKRSSSRYGYCSSRLMPLYGSRHSDTTFPVYDAIATYATAHPAPAGSSGWFLPGRYELATLCFGVPINFDESGSTYYYKNLQMLNKINPQIDKASGTKLIGKYWSSNEYEGSAWYVNLDSSGYYMDPKNNTYKVRAVLAF